MAFDRLRYEVRVTGAARRRGVYALLTALAISVAAVLVADSAFGPEDRTAVAILSTVGASALALLLAVHWWRLGLAALVFEDGLVFRTRAKDRPLLYSDIERIFREDAPLSREPDRAHRDAYEVVLRMQWFDGELAIDSRDFERQVIEDVCAAALPRLVARDRDRLSAGLPLEYGPLTIEGRELKLRGAAVPLASLERGALRDGLFSLYREGEEAPLAEVRLGNVPNGPVLVAVLRHLGVPIDGAAA